MKSKVLRRATAIGAVTVFAASLLVGCSSKADKSPSSGDATSNETVTLTVWGWREDGPWVELMNSYQPPEGVTFEYKGYKADEYNQILQTGFGSSSGPDAVMLRSYGGLETLVAGGSIAALDPNFKALQNIPGNLIEGATSHADGNIYGVPFQSVTANILYNKTEFDRLGLQEPTTWDEFIKVCDAIMADGKTPLGAGVLDSWILPIYRDLFGAAAYGGPEFATELLDGDKTFESSEYVAANQVMLDLAPYLPTGFEGLSYSDANAMFVTGSALMYPGGIWELPQFQEAITDFEIGIFNAPRVDGAGEAFAMGYLDGAIGMSAGLEGAEKEAAEDFLNWVGSDEFGQAVADKLLSIPAVNGVTPSDPLLAKAAEWFEANPTPYLTYVYFDFGTPSGTSLEYDDLQKMMVGQMTPEQVGEAVQAGISQWFEPSTD